MPSSASVWWPFCWSIANMQHAATLSLAPADTTMFSRVCIDAWADLGDRQSCPVTLLHLLDRWCSLVRSGPEGSLVHVGLPSGHLHRRPARNHRFLRRVLERVGAACGSGVSDFFFSCLVFIPSWCHLISNILDYAVSHQSFWSQRLTDRRTVDRFLRQRYASLRASSIHDAR